MKIKKTFAFFILAVFFISCSQNKKMNESIQESSNELIQKSDEKVNKTYTTASGKSLQVLIDKSSNSLNDLAIVPLDFKNSRDTFRINDADPFKEAWLLDLDKNGYDELYIITSSVGSGSYGTIYGYASNQDLSITPIYVPPISEDDTMKTGPFFGYMGHDSIFIEQQKITRKFPIYNEGDPNCCPTGGDNILSYRLKAGEASWILEVEN